jgi:hypothetical protein
MRAQKGGAVVVAVAIEAGEPRVLLSTFLKTHAEGDPLSFEPYHAASAMPRDPDGKASPEAVAAVAEGRRQQDELAADALRGLVEEICDQPITAALLVNRAGWITDLLGYSLGGAEHAAVAEGLAVREAVRFACRQCGLEIVEQDEKSLPARAAEALSLSANTIEGRLKSLGTTAGKPWRKEQKLACLAAWAALAEHS